MNYIKLLFFSLLTTVLIACGGEGGGLPSQGSDGGKAVPAIVSLQVVPVTTRVPVGFEQQYRALATLDDGSVMDVTTNPLVYWATDNSTIATIDHLGLVKGLASGSVTITASGMANGTSFSASAQLEVTNAVVTTLQITPADASVPAGFGQQFIATAVLSDGSTLDVTNDNALSWSSSDISVATIENNRAKKGRATGTSPGLVTITASGVANGTSFSTTAQLEITDAVVTALLVTPATTSVPVGLERQFTAIAILSDGSTLDVTNDTALSWGSNDVGKASILSNQTSGNGVATGIATGAVTITASGMANGTSFSASAQLEVTNAVVTTLQITPADASVPAGFGQQFIATAVLSDGSTLDVTNDNALSWSSSDISVATIENNRAKKGRATGTSPGLVTITASGVANGTSFSTTAQLEITDAVVVDFVPSIAAFQGPIGSTQQLRAFLVFSDNSKLDVTDDVLRWESENVMVAIVSNTGLPDGNGMVRITGLGKTNVHASLFTLGNTYFASIAVISINAP